MCSEYKPNKILASESYQLFSIIIFKEELIQKV